jgi:hypothetical protein
MNSEDDRLAYFEAQYRETGDAVYARRAYEWARDATDQPSQDIPEWVLEYFDRETAKLLELDQHVRADFVRARVTGEKKNGRNKQPKRESYFVRLAEAVGWNPWPRLREQEHAFIARQVVEHMHHSKPKPGTSRMDRVKHSMSKNKAVPRVAKAFNVSDTKVKAAVRAATIRSHR